MPAPKYPTADEVSRCYPVPPMSGSYGPLANTSDYCYGNFDSNLLFCQIMTGFNQVGRGVIVQVHDVCWVEGGATEVKVWDKQIPCNERLPLMDDEV